jgi:hypothetical protein
MRQLEFFEPGPALCEWCAEPTDGRAFCKGGKCKHAYQRKHGKIAGPSHGVKWAPATSPAAPSSETRKVSTKRETTPAQIDLNLPRCTECFTTSPAIAEPATSELSDTPASSGREIFRAWQNKRAPEWAAPIIAEWLKTGGPTPAELFRMLERRAAE